MKKLIISTLVLFSVVLCMSTSVMAKDYGEVYRLYNAGNKEHLYTPDLNEYNTLQRRGWKGEGLAWIAGFTGKTQSQPVYRLYSRATNEHLYTKNRNEINTLVRRGWSMDNGGKPMFDGVGSIGIYRLYHPGIKRHHLTANTTEYRALMRQGWRGEGLTFCGFDYGE